MVVENVKMAFAVMLLAGIMIWSMSIFWPEVGQNIAEVNDTSTAAYGNFSEMYNLVPERGNTVLAVSMVVLLIFILFCVYAYYTRIA
jgi:hypothetical protein